MSVSSTSSTSGTTAIQDLASALIKNFDTNKDGALSSDEFSGLVKQLAAQFGVQSIPTFILFKGGKVADRMMGAMPKSAFQNFVQRNTA